MLVGKAQETPAFYLHCSVNNPISTNVENPYMTDNLRIKGVESDEHPAARMRKANKRRTYAIECRYIRTNRMRRGDSLGWLWDGLREWFVWKRYKTESARDEAFAAVVKKAHLERSYFTIKEFRKA